MTVWGRAFLPVQAERSSAKLLGHGRTRIYTAQESVKIRVNRGLNFKVVSKGVSKLQFQIKGKEYFLAFVEDEKRWYVFSPTAQGINRFPVYVDAVKYEKPGVLEIETSLSS